MSTMTHTPEQKKAWHAGKRKSAIARIERMLVEQKATKALEEKRVAELDEAGQREEAKLAKRRKRNIERKAKRTKGLPYFRCKVADMIPARRGFPGSGVIALEHPTRGRVHVVAADRVNVERWVPEAFRKMMLGEAV